MTDNGEGSSRSLDLDPVLVGVPSAIAFPVIDQDRESSEGNQRYSPPVLETSLRDEEGRTQLPPSHPLIISRLRQPFLRQNNCNHGTVTRQYSIDEYETCDNCGRRPFLRWFYLCNEDISGFSAPIDPESSILSQWIIDAIIAGEYTEEQKELLIRQKLEVLRMRERDIRSAIPSLSFVEPGHVTNAGQIVTQVELGSFETTRTTIPLDEDEPNFTVSPRAQLSAPCSYRACHHCDRKLQERTWLSINEICNDRNGNLPTAWDLWDRPVSDTRTVRNLGLRSPPRSPHIGSPEPESSQNDWIRYGLGSDSLRNRSNLNLQDLLSTIKDANEGVDIGTGELHECSIKDIDNALGISMVASAEERPSFSVMTGSIYQQAANTMRMDDDSLYS